jgi:hypothetical protein
MQPLLVAIFQLNQKSRFSSFLFWNFGCPWVVFVIVRS